MKSKSSIIKKTTIILLFLLITIHAHSQETKKENERPRIGLVLSGGGAKGLAHVGVLKAIDEAGLPIDYITGTSMGAIIAAMYASGYSGEEIEKIARSMNWLSNIMGEVDYQNISIERKNEFKNYIIEVPVENYFSIKPLSTGVIEPYEIGLKFSEVFFPVYKTKDFSKLPIPFKCIATDISSGEAVILDKGDLPFAVRSSMAIPGAFTATNMGKRKLVDGGIVRNFPVTDVIEMGADYVIGVNLFAGLTPADKINTLMDVFSQVTNFRDAKDLETEKSICDMIIEPDVANYSAASFGDADKIFAIGDSIGQDFLPLFKQLADSLHNGYGVPYQKKDRLQPYAPKVFVNDIETVGLKYTDEKMFLHNLRLKEGFEYTPQQINDAFKHAYSSQYYNNLRYELNPIDTNRVNMRCIIEENTLQSLKVALSYDTFTSASLIFGYQMKNILGFPSTTDIKISLSESFRFRVHNRAYFGKRINNFFDQKYEFTRFNLPLYGDKQKEKVYTYLHNNVYATYGHIIEKYSMSQISAGFEVFKLSPDVTGDNDVLDGRISNFYIDFRRLYDTTNRKLLPTKGITSEWNVYAAFYPHYSLKKDSLIDRDNIYRISWNSSFYQSPTERLTLIENVAFAASWGDKTFVHQTFVGGVRTYMPSHFIFYGLNTAQKPESTLAIARLGLQYRLLGELYATLNINSGITFDSVDAYFGKDRKNFTVEKWIHGIGITAAYNFSYFPFDITLMYSPDYKFNVAVNVGFPF